MKTVSRVYAAVVAPSPMRPTYPSRQLDRHALSVYKKHSPWLTILASAIVASLSIPVYNSYLFGLFIKPISTEFNWERGTVALAVTFVTYTIMFVSPLFGSVVDRFGSKRVMVPSIVGFAVIVASLYFVHPSPGWFYAHHVILALVALGTLPINYTRVIVVLFAKHRGLALGLALSGVGVGAVFYPPVVQYVMDLYGWRAGYPAIGALMLIIALPVVILLFREPGTTSGLLTDAGLPAREAAMGGFTFREAIRERSFLLLATNLTLLGIVSAGTTTHIAAMLSDRGMSPGGAAQGLVVLGGALIFGRIGAGILLDRFNPPIVASLVMASATVGLVLMATSPGLYGTFFGIFLLGLGLGSEFDFLSFFIGRQLGMRAYGTIYGWIYSGFMLGSGIGAPMIGYTFDYFHSYVYGMLILATVQGVVAVLFLGLNAPKQFGPKPEFQD